MDISLPCNVDAEFFGSTDAVEESGVNVDAVLEIEPVVEDSVMVIADSLLTISWKAERESVESYASDSATRSGLA